MACGHNCTTMGNMNITPQQSTRICVEIGAPAPIAVVMICALGCTPDKVGDVLLGLPNILAIAYAFAFIPSVVFAFLMEMWFGYRMQFRCGALATIGLSMTLVAGIGYVVQILLSNEATISYFVPIGALDGLVIGIVLYRNSISE